MAGKSATVKSLPLFGTIVDAYKFVWERRREFFQFTLLWIIILSALQFCMGALEETTTGTVLTVIHTFTQMAVTLGFTIAWYRFLLAGADPKNQWINITFLRREWKLLGYGLLIGFAFMIILGVLLGIVNLGVLLFGGEVDAHKIVTAISFILLLPVLVFFGFRFSFLSPLIALDNFGMKMFRESWDATRTVVWKLVGFFILGFIPVLILMGLAGVLLMWMPAAFGGGMLLAGVFEALTALVNVLFSFFTTALSGYLVSQAYKFVHKK